MADSDSDDLDIYITNSSSNIEDELVTYLEEKREDRKVSKIHLNYIKLLPYTLLIFLYKLILIYI
jgi:hypothetical protein